MAFKAIPPAKIPAFEVVLKRLELLYPEVSISETARDFDTEAYCLRLIGPTNRTADLVLSRELLEDLRDNPPPKDSKYSTELLGRLDSLIQKSVETRGLISFSEDALRLLLLWFLNSEANGNAVNKWNIIGRGMKGRLEIWLKTEFLPNEKQSLMWAWKNLEDQRMIASTGTDLVAPDDWVSITDRGRFAFQGKSLDEYSSSEGALLEALTAPTLQDRSKRSSDEGTKGSSNAPDRGETNLVKYDGWQPLSDDRQPDQEKLLGKGGQGRVYLARSPELVVRVQRAKERVLQNILDAPTGGFDAEELARLVRELGASDPENGLGALKQFQIATDNKEEEAKAVGRLEAEVKALDALKGQPGVLKLLHSNIPERFIVTEYHSRGTLDKHIGYFKGNAPAALEAFRPLVAAVCKIHEAGAIHRDIKPENIFVNNAGGLVLGDFGIVFFQHGSERLTSTFERVGSHEWMAPWAYKRSKLALDDVGPTLDIFPLAKVLWCMISGENMLPYWEYESEENNLAQLFPYDTLMPLINEHIFAKRIVRYENGCDGSARNLLSAVDGLIDQIEKKRGYKPDGATNWFCQICGTGVYQISGMNYTMEAIRHGGSINSQILKLDVCVCNHCGHAELFQK